MFRLDAPQSRSPESLYDIAERGRAVRYEVAGLPLRANFVIRHLYGIGCDAIGHAEVATKLGRGTTVESVKVTERDAIGLLRIALAHLSFSC